MLNNINNQFFKNKEDKVVKKDSKMPCLDPAHEPPNYLSIPNNETYIHTCPSCGRKITLIGNSISF